MKSRILTLVSAIALFAALANPVGLAAQTQQPQQADKPQHYKLTVLPTLGGTFGYGGGINNRGSVVGNSTTPGDQEVHGFLWQNGMMTDVGTLGGPNSWTANPSNGLNDRGAVSGYSDTSAPDPNGEDVCGDGNNLICLPYVWQKGVMTALPLLGGNNGQASEINNRGQIVGGAETPTSDPTCSLFFLQVEPVIWQNGSVEELPLLSGDPDGFAGEINDKGQAVGVSGCVGTNIAHAVLWPNGPNGGVIDLGNLGGTVNLPGDINNKTQVAGQADVPGGTHHAFLWQDGVMTDLGNLPGLPTSFADGINNQGQVIGVSQDANGDDFSSVAFLWQNGVITDLNTLIPPGSPLFLQEPESINDRGQIVGFGLLSDGEQRGFLLTPCDEHHPGVEGCDYSLADAPATTRVSPVPITQHPEALPPGSRMSKGMFNRFRFPWGRLSPSSGTTPAVGCVQNQLIDLDRLDMGAFGGHDAAQSATNCGRSCWGQRLPPYCGPHFSSCKFKCSFYPYPFPCVRECVCWDRDKHAPCRKVC